MSDTDRIYQKYMAVFYDITGADAWIGLDAVRYALRAALREMADGVMRPAPAAADQRQVEARNRQLERLNDWLVEHAHDLAHDPYTDTAGAMIAAADRLRQHVAALRVELAAAIDERNAADVGCTDAERAAAQRRNETEQAIAAMNAVMIEAAALRQQLVTLDADNAKLVQELATLRSWVTAPTGNSNGVTDDFGTVITAPGKTRTAPEMLAAAGAANGASALSWPGDLADWVEGLEKGRHDWRKLTKSVRWQLIANVVNQVKDSVQFDANRPQWMSTARAAALTFGDGKWETVVARAHAGEVAP